MTKSVSDDARLRLAALQTALAQSNDPEQRRFLADVIEHYRRFCMLVGRHDVALETSQTIEVSQPTRRPAPGQAAATEPAPH